ncbi:SDR family oxidoreductase [Peribacillus frigoritolerans]|uniref:SDR family oxidoreductase n=1 Tax=Peribacillus frigoritolerans TaxID=450367 RepID=UPI0020BF3820|nr:SDR family oxidoreductase [Peribacillus frigoritolerans]
MTNEQAIGKIFADEKVDHTDKSIPRADVAAVLAQSQRKACLPTVFLKKRCS